MNNFKNLPVPMFSEAASVNKVSATRDIRDSIASFLTREADAFRLILDYLLPDGRTGNRTMDMGFACDVILQGTDLQSRYSHLNHSMLNPHLVAVLRSRGYVMEKGRLVGHVLTHNTDEGTAPNAEALAAQVTCSSAAIDKAEQIAASRCI